MRICFLGSFTGGGTESACFKIANELVKVHTVFILSTSKIKNSFYLNEKIQFSNIVNDSLIGKNIEVSYFLIKEKIDVLVTLEAMAGIFSIFPALVTGCKHIIWEHANYYQNQGGKYIQKIRQIELKLTNAYVVLTKRDLKNFQIHFRSKAYLTYIYNIAPPQTDNPYNLESKVIISVGHIRKIKNFIVIPDIAQRVFEKHSDWCWKIYGTMKGEEYEKLKLKIRKYGLQDKIIFMGRCENMNVEYQKASIYVMTSLQEGLPMVLLEAKSNKLPLVSFDIETGPSEIIQDGINGYLIPPYEISTMAESISRLIDNKELRKKFSDNAKLDLDKFETTTIIDHWNKLIESIGTKKI